VPGGERWGWQKRKLAVASFLVYGKE